MPRTIVSGSEYMTLNEDGTITRKTWKGSQAWKVTGAVTRNNFGGITQRWTLADILNNPSVIPWRFKNGKQHTFLRDLDHGTMREWRSPQHWVS